MGGQIKLRAWQKSALRLWEASSYRGIVSVVTGGGKTVFALAGIEHLRPTSTLIVVPTAALLDQWWAESASYFGLELEEINVITRSNSRIKLGVINIAVINTASKIFASGHAAVDLLIVDECHRAASESFSSVFNITASATLGLSATPDRDYDNELAETLIPNLGPVIFSYDYGDALRDGVIVPFRLKNVIFELEEERKKEYDRLTRSIARSVEEHGVDSEETVRLFIRRSRVLNLSLNRLRIALSIVNANRDKRSIIFHEDVEACDLIHKILSENNVSAGVYHSKIPMRDRVTALQRFRAGDIDVLVTCRALDEGFNVPEAEIGIIAASTATRRQRIQRLGRVVRPSKGKGSATIYTIIATKPEIERLRMEAIALEGIAEISWENA